LFSHFLHFPYFSYFPNFLHFLHFLPFPNFLMFQIFKFFKVEKFGFFWKGRCETEKFRGLLHRVDGSCNSQPQSAIGRCRYWRNFGFSPIGWGFRKRPGSSERLQAVTSWNVKAPEQNCQIDIVDLQCFHL
jgi:hypothetical protein